MAEFSDAEISGDALLTRPGAQALLAAARRRDFDVVVAEAMDRISRDMEHTSAIYKRLWFARIRIVTLSEGEITLMHVGFKGVQNAEFLRDLSLKTHRGQHGRVLAGKCAGGLCYGYAPVVGQAGDRVIVEPEAAIVRRVFAEFVGGHSPKGIAKRLNGERITGPHGHTWHPSTINGSVQRGTGLLNNELYIGVYVWNRLQYLKDPETEKRVSVLRPSSEWARVSVPAWRIVSDDLWQAAKDRQTRLRVGHVGFMRRKRPVYLFSGLTRCAVCGSGYCMFNRTRLACSGARERGICANRQTIPRTDIEARVIAVLQDKLWRSDVFEAYRQIVTDGLQADYQQKRAAAASAGEALATVQRQLARTAQLLTEGVDSSTLRAQLVRLEEQERQLRAQQRQPVVRPVVPPDLAQEFRREVLELGIALNEPARQVEARDAMRRYITAIELTPTPEALKIDVLINPQEIFASVGVNLASSGGCGGLQQLELAQPWWEAA